MTSRRTADADPSKPSRWEASAIKENARRVAEAPLFAHAGLVTMTTAAERQVVVEKSVAAFEERLASVADANAVKAAELRSAVAARVSPDELARLDAYRLIFPRSSEYTVAHWKDELAKLDAPSSPLEEPRELGPTCIECGWIRGCGAMHPPNCPGLRGLIYGLGRCDACADRSRSGGCQEHVAEVKAVDAGEREPAMPGIFPQRS